MRHSFLAIQDTVHDPVYGTAYRLRIHARTDVNKQELLTNIALSSRSKKRRIGAASSTAAAAVDGAAEVADAAADDFLNVDWDAFDDAPESDSSSSSSSSDDEDSDDDAKKKKKKSKKSKKNKKEEKEAESPKKAKAKAKAAAKATAKQIANSEKMKEAARLLAKKVSDALAKLDAEVLSPNILDISPRVLARVKDCIAVLKETRRKLMLVVGGQADPESGQIQAVQAAVAAAKDVSSILKKSLKALEKM